jgi:hypothetical protein
MTEKDRLDDEVDELQERSERLEQEISDVREDWERKKADDAVPGAVGEATGDAAQETGSPPPEATKPG